MTNRPRRPSRMETASLLRSPKGRSHTRCPLINKGRGGNTYCAGIFDRWDNIDAENSITYALQGVQPHQFIFIIGKRIRALLIIVIPELDTNFGREYLLLPSVFAAGHYNQ